MRIEFSTRALIDLEELHDYLKGKSPRGYQNVVSAIEVLIRDIPDNLFRGRETPIDEVWERLERKYGYVIPYTVRGDVCYILRVYHAKRSGLDYTKPFDIKTGLAEKN
ncbi:MAG: type II toxin-antitoxin system RelE/ParE family toxin [Jhaorihella sp.]